MSAMVRMTDSTRAWRHVANVPQADLDLSDPTMSAHRRSGLESTFPNSRQTKRHFFARDQIGLIATARVVQRFAIPPGASAGSSMIQASIGPSFSIAGNTI